MAEEKGEGVELEKLYCVKCGKCMTDDDGTNIVGVSLKAFQGRQILASDITTKFLQKQLGKYKIGKRYDFCWECWLDSLFGNQIGGKHG